MNDPTNADLYGVLLDIKEDIGGLKSTSALQLKALENHGGRIGTLENAAARQRGAIKVWGLVATGAASFGAVIAQLWRAH